MNEILPRVSAPGRHLSSQFPSPPPDYTHSIFWKSEISILLLNTRSLLLPPRLKIVLLCTVNRRNARSLLPLSHNQHYKSDRYPCINPFPRHHRVIRKCGATFRAILVAEWICLRILRKAEEMLVGGCELLCVFSKKINYMTQIQIYEFSVWRVYWSCSVGNFELISRWNGCCGSMRGQLYRG
jgi:hypothetical protein